MNATIAPQPGGVCCSRPCRTSCLFCACCPCRTRSPQPTHPCALRQVPVKGAWHWNAFEQEPEKTWDGMQVFFEDLVDVSPPQECRVPPYSGVNTLSMVDGRWVANQTIAAVAPEEGTIDRAPAGACPSDYVLVSRLAQGSSATH